MTNVTMLRTVAAPEQEAVDAQLTGFEDIPPIMSPKTLAAVLEVTTLTLQRWRDRKEGPIPTLVPNSNVIRYTRAEVLAWLTANRAEWDQA